MGKLVFSSAADICELLVSADWSAIETVTNGGCLRIWLSGQEQQDVRETGENYLIKTSIIYVLGQILGR
jgi:hypothetical protein